MALFTEQQIRARFESEKRSRNSRGYRYFSATEALNEGRITDSTQLYDIFLSHSSLDNELIAGLKLILEDMGLKVYVDWNDKRLDPNHVTPETAVVLRERMKQCKSLLYAFERRIPPRHPISAAIRTPLPGHASVVFSRPGFVPVSAGMTLWVFVSLVFTGMVTTGETSADTADSRSSA